MGKMPEAQNFLIPPRTNDTSTCIENDYNFINNDLRIMQTAASNLSGHSHKTVLYHKIL